jgi:2-amino-4-hydroxy-6-hydroxymethyldihydropteridine diphosphokinase
MTEPAGFDALIGLGTNIGDKAANIAQAIALLAADDDVRLVAKSRLYRSEPWGVVDQDWFVNAVVSVATTLSPHDLLKRCQSVENRMGRIRDKRWGPRVIDVDVLTYRNQTIDTPDLKVPHPLIAERAFVVLPMGDVAPDIVIDKRSLTQMRDMLGGAINDVKPMTDAQQKAPRDDSGAF